MPLYLVDDRDGRILLELRSEEQAARILEAMARDDPNVPDYLCLVESRSSQGSVLGVDSTLKLRTFGS
jgi:hypothetical protein